MGTEIQAVINDFRKTICLEGKRVAVIGAGGGQLSDLYIDAKHIVAVDSDRKALEKLERTIHEKCRTSQYSFLCAAFQDIAIKVDCLVFEFYFHEMSNHKEAFIKAKEIANEVVILDHYWESEWTYCVDEYEKVQNVKRFMESNPPDEINSYMQYQVFGDYVELRNKVSIRGEKAMAAIEKYRNREDIRIEFSYMICNYN